MVLAVKEAVIIVTWRYKIRISETLTYLRCMTLKPCHILHEDTYIIYCYFLLMNTKSGVFTRGSPLGATRENIAFGVHSVK